MLTLKKLMESRATISGLLLVVAIGLFLNLFTLWTRDTGSIPLAFGQSSGGLVAVTTVGNTMGIAWIEGGRCFWKIIGQNSGGC